MPLGASHTENPLFSRKLPGAGLGIVLNFYIILDTRGGGLTFLFFGNFRFLGFLGFGGFWVFLC